MTRWLQRNWPLVVGAAGLSILASQVVLTLTHQTADLTLSPIAGGMAAYPIVSGWTKKFKDPE